MRMPSLECGAGWTSVSCTRGIPPGPRGSWATPPATESGPCTRCVVRTRSRSDLEAPRAEDDRARARAIDAGVESAPRWSPRVKFPSEADSNADSNATIRAVERPIASSSLRSPTCSRSRSPALIFPPPSPPTLPPRLFSRSHQVYCSPEHKVGHVFSLVARKEQPPSCALTHCLKARFLPCGFCLAINMYNWIAVVAAREHEITNELYELPIGEFAKENFIRIKFKADFYQCMHLPLRLAVRCL